MSELGLTGWAVAGRMGSAGGVDSAGELGGAGGVNELDLAD